MNYPRPLSTDEKALVRWMIQNGDDPDSRYLEELDKAVVIGGCDCGCESIDFQIGESPPDYSKTMDVISDWIYKGVGEDEVFGAYIFTHGGHLSGLDLSTYSGPPAKLPRPEDLLPLENNLPNNKRSSRTEERSSDLNDG